MYSQCHDLPNRYNAGSVLKQKVIEHHGRVAKWLEPLTAVQNIDGASRTLGS